jgi:hypothetical protein
VITGCQRSGTTLLNLMLDSHPDLNGVDEGQFEPDRLMHFRTNRSFHPVVVLKLPQFSHMLPSLVTWPAVRILWLERDPRDVVASMLKLKMKRGEPRSYSWAVYPACGPAEIESCVRVLSPQRRAELAGELSRWEKIRCVPPSNRTRPDAIALAACPSR